MREFMNQMWEWRFALAVAVAFFVWCTLDWEKAKGRLFQLMLLAKGKAKDLILSSGKEQEDWVVTQAWRFLPLKFRIFLTEETLRKIIQWLYRQAKDKLDDGQFNGSV